MNKRQSKKALRYKAIRMLEDMLQNERRIVINLNGERLLIADCKEMNISTTEGRERQEMLVNISADCEKYYSVPIRKEKA